MPITTVDPVPALVVVDLQKGVLAGRDLAHPSADVVARTARLAEAFHRHGHPVVWVTATGVAPGRTDAARRVPAELPPGFADLVDDLDAHPGDHHVVKQRWGAFTGTGLDDHLRASGVTQVVVTGVATSAGVESTARHAHELGYHVVLATDAMTDGSLDAHDASVGGVFPRLGETATTEEILTALG